jgi:hypothetical protein
MSPLPPKVAGGKRRTKVVVVTMLDSGQWVPEAVITFVLSVSAAGAGGLACWAAAPSIPPPPRCLPPPAGDPSSNLLKPQASPPPPQPHHHPHHPITPQVFAPFFYTAVQKVVSSSFSDPAAPLPARIASRPELYGKMGERVDHFLEGHPDAP